MKVYIIVLGFFLSLYYFPSISNASFGSLEFSMVEVVLLSLNIRLCSRWV